MEIANVATVKAVNCIATKVSNGHTSKRVDWLSIVRVCVWLARLVLEIKRHASSLASANN